MLDQVKLNAVRPRVARVVEAVCGAALLLAILVPTTARAHATLVGSQPAANEHLAQSPARIYLTFSEEVLPRLCQIRILDAHGSTFELPVSGDPQNASAISGAPARLAAGLYRVEWRVLSADGHPAHGSFAFTVGEETPAAIRDSQVAAVAIAASDSTVESGATIAGVPAFLAAIRGAAIAALLGAAGLLVLALGGGRSGVDQPRVRAYCAVLTAAAALLFVGHFVGWLAHTAPNQQLTSDWARLVLETAPGRIEAARTLLALLAAGALLIARRPTIAAVFAGAAVLASGAAGHSAAITPALSIPLKSLHLAAASLWFGGVLWLVLTPDSQADFARIARRVSAFALTSVLLIAVSGVAQALLIAPIGALITSPYGLVLGAKTALFLVLIGFGCFHRFRVLPSIAELTQCMRLRVSAGRESTLMLVVLLLAGLLAYVPTPQRETHTAAIHGSVETR